MLLAERVGFEPTDRRRSTVFKTAAFDHSATSPINLIVARTVAVASAGRRFLPPCADPANGKVPMNAWAFAMDIGVPDAGVDSGQAAALGPEEQTISLINKDIKTQPYMGHGCIGAAGKDTGSERGLPA